jgi:hypothetical protein
VSYTRSDYLWDSLNIAVLDERWHRRHPLDRRIEARLQAEYDRLSAEEREREEAEGALREPQD